MVVQGGGTAPRVQTFFCDAFHLWNPFLLCIFAIGFAADEVPFITAEG